MIISDIQTLLAKAGLYQLAIDGDAGSKTWDAVYRAEQKYEKDYNPAPWRWSKKRRLIGAGQAVLDDLGFEPGDVDGYSGHNTREALTQFKSQQAGTDATLDRVPQGIFKIDPMQDHFPLQKDLARFYGSAGGNLCTAGKVNLPFTMKIAWNLRQKINRFSCHQLVAKPLEAIFKDALAHYGQAEISRLELDMFGGCYNYRKMRGGRSLSTHAYGVAVDLNPIKNQLRWGTDRAQFARGEYKPFWKIVMARGGVPAGYAWGRDWMHFQFARLG